jgi:hypothetical protein
MVSLNFEQHDIPTILQALHAASNQGVEIQLKIIQTLLLVMTYCADVHEKTLGDVSLS